MKDLDKNLKIIGTELIVILIILCCTVITATINANRQLAEINKSVNKKMEKIDGTFVQINNKFDLKERMK